jgi:sugar lactone lactonase YvrE
MRSTEARILIEPRQERNRYLLEGPRMSEHGGKPALVWVNIQTAEDAKTGEIGMLPDSSREPQWFSLPARPGFIIPIAPGKGGRGRLFVGMDKSLAVFDLNSGQVARTLATIPDSDPRTMINDAQVAPGGKAVVFGTKVVGSKEPLAHMYLYTVDDNRVTVLADRQSCSNGKVFYTDDRGLILYDIDTPTHRVARYRLDVAARKATFEAVAIDLKDRPGSPDGMRNCGDGTVIVAFYNKEYLPAGKAVRFDLQSGNALEEWTTPGSPRVTCPLLAQRSDGVKLYLTTAVEGMPADLRSRCPNAGCLFVADTQLETCPAPQEVVLD